VNQQMNPDEKIKKYTLITISLASFLTPFMGNAVNLAIPSIGKEFNSSAILLSWVVSSFLLASASLLLPFGRLADIIGRKKLFLAGVLAFSLFSLLCGLAWSIKALIVFRVLQGAGGAMIFSTGIAILTSVFPPQKRGRVLGYTTATTYTGLSLGPALGGLINQRLGWQYIFHFSSLLGILILTLTIFKLKGEWAGAKGEKFDLAGASLYVVCLAAFLYGLSSLFTSTPAKFICLLGLIGLAFFCRRELKIEQPIFKIGLFIKNAGFAFSNLAALINYSATFAVTFLLSLFLQIVLEYDSERAGFVLLAQPVIMALLSLFAGRLSDRVEPRIVASWGMGLTMAGLFFFSFLTGSTPIWLAVANLALLGTGFAFFSSPNTNAVMGSVEKRFYGVASSTLGTMRLTGQAISLAVASMIIDLYMGSAQLSPAYAGLLLKSIKISFLLFALTCLGGIFASLARGNISTNESNN